MPNWCENKLTVQDPTPSLQAYLKEHGFSFARMCPVEETDDPDDDIRAISRQADVWGTKWDLTETEGNLVAADLVGSGEAFFNTAWSPPVQALRALSLRCPGDTLRLDYHEPGMMFAGSASFHGGRVHQAHVEDGPSVMRIGREVFGYEDEDDDEDG
ncbi:MAG: hypothetical protein K9N23_21685 [Akkermansiaceae bacterium]|nr:hypothetical protein [Akkermansiaceae bacterium]